MPGQCVMPVQRSAHHDRPINVTVNLLMPHIVLL